MNQFDSTVNNMLSFVDKNEYVSAGLSLFLVLYAGLAAPQLPENVARMFENPLFKLLILFLIAYSAKKNPTVAIIAAVGVMVSMNTLARYNLNNVMAQVMATVGLDSEAEAEADEVVTVPEGAQEGLPAEMVMEEVAGIPEMAVPEDVLAELQTANGGDGGSCDRQANFKNSFYPMYANMKPDAYMARYTGNAVSGFDSSASYASI